MDHSVVEEENGEVTRGARSQFKAEASKLAARS